MIGRRQLLIYADDVNILGGTIHTVNKNTEASVLSSKVTGLAVNAGETKHMVMSCGKQAEQNHNIVGNKSFERVEWVKYLGTTIKIKFRTKLKTD